MGFLFDLTDSKDGAFEECVEFGQPVDLSYLKTSKSENADTSSGQLKNAGDRRKYEHERRQNVAHLLTAFSGDTDFETRLGKERSAAMEHKSASKHSKNQIREKEDEDEEGNRPFMPTNPEKKELLSSNTMTSNVSSLHLLPCFIEFSGAAPIHEYFRPLPICKPAPDSQKLKVPRQLHCQTDSTKMELLVATENEVVGYEPHAYEAILHGRWLVGKEVHLNGIFNRDSNYFHDSAQGVVEGSTRCEGRKRKLMLPNSAELPPKLRCFIGYAHEKTISDKEILEAMCARENMTTCQIHSTSREPLMCINAAIDVHHIWNWDQDGIGGADVDVKKFFHYLRASAALHATSE